MIKKSLSESVPVICSFILVILALLITNANRLPIDLIL